MTRLWGTDSRGKVNLTLSPLAGPSFSFAAPLAIKALAIDRVDEAHDGSKTIVRRLSTLLSGTLYMTSLSGEALVLRRGESLRFGSAEGILRSIDLQDGHIVLSFQGRVRAMSVGSADNPRTLMPTLLEWLRARHGLQLLWGTAIYLFGLSLAVLRWWGIVR